MSTHNILKQLDVTAQSIALPSDSPVQRYPTYPAIEMTAVFDYRLNETVTVTPDDPVTPAGGVNRFVLTRDAGGAFLRDEQVNHAAMNFHTEPILFTAIRSDTEYALSKMMPATINSRSPIVDFGGNQWVLVPTILQNGNPTTAFTNMQVIFYIDGVPSVTAGILIELEIYQNDGLFSTTVVPSTTPVAISQQTALVRVASIGLPGGLPTAPWTGQATLQFLTPRQPTYKCLMHPWDYGVNPEYNNAPAPFQSSRINASSLLLTNVTKVLNKEGTVLAGRMVATVTGDATTPLCNFAGVSTVNASNPATRYFGALERGSYSFTAPDIESLQFSTPYSVLSNTIVTPGAPVNITYAVLTPEGRFYNAHFLTDSDSTPGNLSSLAVAVDTHYEFRTKSTLFQLDYSRMPLELYHAASLAVMKAGLFYENEWHKALINGVIKAAKWAAPVLANAYGGPTAMLVKGAADLAAKKIQSSGSKPAPKPKPKSKAARTGVRAKKSKVKGSMRQKGLR